MAKRMLVDAAHPEETRVTVVSGNKLEEFDFESTNKLQLKGNIYLAKVTRVEPSLQAAFVEYGGNRHGFLAFSEIHPDYYRIPVADRDALLAEEARRAAAEDDAPCEPRDADEDGGNGRPRGGKPSRGRGRGRSRRSMPLVADAAGPGEATDALSEPVAMSETDDRPEADQADTETDSTSEADAGPGAPPDAANPTEVPSAEDRSAEAMPAADRETFTALPDGVDAAAAENGVDGSAVDGHGDVETAARTDRDEPVDEPVPDTNAEMPESLTAGDGGAEGAARSGHDVPDADGIEADAAADAALDSADDEDGNGGVDAFAPVETIGGDMEEEVAPMPPRRPMRSYKIQEVIKRRQIMLVQVTKEERGNKGAALTTYLSLAGRYCVLMPNTPRGGGVSRKISNAKDRKRMKAILEDLEVPEGMAVILRTAGLERTKAEIKRDFDYLLRLWDSIRELTLKSTAPCLIHEEANLIKRAIRDLYAKEIDEILVAGDDGYRTAKDFMKMLMPSHAKKVQQYRDPVPLFHRHQVEGQIEQMHNPEVQLRSGGYIVISPTEALVAIDVNSGRATRERNIEETAYKTNLEAADEVARQLRLRDLAGLIVIDFIDMEEDRHNVAVERRLKEAMKIDRARVQLGRISPFGLLELSRQRLRPSFMETHFHICPTCSGHGFVRTLSSAALYALRVLEDEAIRQRAAELNMRVPADVALYIVNQKREALQDIEARYRLRVYLVGDDTLSGAQCQIERLRPRTDEDFADPVIDTARLMAETDAAAAADLSEAEAVEADDEDADESGDKPSRKRTKRSRRRRRDEPAAQEAAARDLGAASPVATEDAEVAADAAGQGAAVRDDDAVGDDDGDIAADGEDEASKARKRRRRGRRGGRRRSGQRGGELDGDGDGDGEALADEALIDEEGDDAAEAPAFDEAALSVAEDNADEADEPAERGGSAGRGEDVGDSFLPALSLGSGPIEIPIGAAPPQVPEDQAPEAQAPGAELPPEPSSERRVGDAPTEAVADPESDSELPTPRPAEPVLPAAGEANGPQDETGPDDEDSEHRRAVSAPYTVIDKPPEKPRRGWWSRLIEG